MSNENANLTKVIVPCRFSYLHCWEPNAVSDGDFDAVEVDDEEDFLG